MNFKIQAGVRAAAHPLAASSQLLLMRVDRVEENSAVFASFDGQEHLHGPRFCQPTMRLSLADIMCRHCYNALHAQPWPKLSTALAERSQEMLCEVSALL